MESDRNKFIQTSSIFLVILVLIFLIIGTIPLIVFITSNEGYTLDNIVKTQSSNEKELLFGPAYSDYNKLYKVKMTNEVKANVITIGTSRTMQFREEFFNTSFYNAGGCCARFNQFKPFITNIISYKPEIIIIGLDQYFFNDNYETYKEIQPYNETISKISSPFLRFRNSINKIYSDVFKNEKIKFSNLEIDNSKIGLNALINNNGFRNDGSYQYGKVIQLDGMNNNSYREESMVDSKTRIVNGNNRFQYGHNISNYSIEKLIEILEYGKANNITIIGFTPPYDHEIWVEMMNRKKDYEYLNKIELVIKPIFEKYNFEFYIYDDLKKLGSITCEAKDGFHGTDMAYARIIKNISQQNSKLNKYIDQDYLYNIIKDNTCFLPLDLQK